MADDEAFDARALHGNKKRWLTIVGGNAALLLLMIGVPWLRGYLRSRALWHSYAAYGACLFGGQESARPGLGLPPGHEASFATRAVREPGWAQRCDSRLAELALPEATFVLPSVKVAEADLRGAVELLRSELLPLAARAPGTRLSVRPLRAFERLRAGLANHTRASGVVEVPEGAAFTIAAPVLPTPTRVPLYAGAHAQLSLWGTDRELHALATDHNGISYVHVEGGQLTQNRVTRPKLLEGALPRAQPTSFVWAMARSRCAEREHGCADKALGVAPVSLPLESIAAPRWLGAHPRGRIDRSLRSDRERVIVAAETAQGDTEVREFVLAGSESPLEASKVWAVRAPGEPLLLAGPRVLMVARSAEGTVKLSALTPSELAPIASLAGAGKPWLVACEDGSQLAFGHEHALVVRRGSEEFEPVPVELADVIDAQDAAYDRVRPLCGSEHTLVHDKAGRLTLIACKPGSKCTSSRIAADVYGFSALVHRSRLIVAYAGAGEQAQVRVRSMSLDGVDGEEQVPAVCWSDSRGLCSTPTLVQVGDRVLLGAREGSDLRVLESGDGGLSWQPLSGLKR